MLTQCLCAVWDILQCIYTFSQPHPFRFSSLSILSFTDFRFRLFVLFSSFPFLPPSFPLSFFRFIPPSFLFLFFNFLISPFPPLTSFPHLPYFPNSLIYPSLFPFSPKILHAISCQLSFFPSIPYTLSIHAPKSPPYSHSLHSFAFSLLQYLLSLITFPNLNSAIFCHTLSPLYFKVFRYFFSLYHFNHQGYYWITQIGNKIHMISKR